MDNYFSSPELFRHLKDNQFGACGTLRVNRTGVPEAIKKTKLKKPGPICIERDGDKILYLLWFDKRQVALMSTVHNSATFQKAVRAKGQPENQRVVEKPMAVELYTKI